MFSDIQKIRPSIGALYMILQQVNDKRISVLATRGISQVPRHPQQIRRSSLGIRSWGPTTPCRPAALPHSAKLGVAATHGAVDDIRTYCQLFLGHHKPPPPQNKQHVSMLCLTITSGIKECFGTSSSLDSFLSLPRPVAHYAAECLYFLQERWPGRGGALFCSSPLRIVPHLFGIVPSERHKVS